ncbi:hypothetical protein ACT453_35385, partial [Bacillus sp. D-CC]
GALAGVFRELGYNVGVYKPLQSGHVASNPEGDAARLKVLSGVSTKEDEICPYSSQVQFQPLTHTDEYPLHVYMQRALLIASPHILFYMPLLLQLKRLTICYVFYIKQSRMLRRENN